MTADSLGVRASRWGHLLVSSTGALLAGLAMTAFAVPLIAAGWIAYPVGALLHAVDRPTPRDALLDFLASRRAASAWHRRASDFTDVALALMRLRADAGDAGATSYAAAESALVTGLRQSPANRLGWLRLAQIRLAEHPRTQTPRPPKVAAGVARALSLSLRYGPVQEPRASLVVAEAGMAGWPHLDARSRRAVTSTIREAWQTRPFATAAAARRAGRPDLLAALVGL